MKPDNNIHVRINGKYVDPCFALARPIRAFHPDLIDIITYRRILTEITMTGVGETVDVIRESIANVKEAIDNDGILRMNFDQPHNKRYSPLHIPYPTALSGMFLAVVGALSLLKLVLKSGKVLLSWRNCSTAH